MTFVVFPSCLFFPTYFKYSCHHSAFTCVSCFFPLKKSHCRTVTSLPMECAPAVGGPALLSAFREQLCAQSSLCSQRTGPPRSCRRAGLAGSPCGRKCFVSSWLVCAQKHLYILFFFFLNHLLCFGEQTLAFNPWVRIRARCGKH